MEGTNSECHLFVSWLLHAFTPPPPDSPFTSGTFRFLSLYKTRTLQPHFKNIFFHFSYKTVNSFSYLALLHFLPFSCLRFYSSIFRDLFLVCLFTYCISSFTFSFSESSTYLSCSLYKNTLPTPLSPPLLSLLFRFPFPIFHFLVVHINTTHHFGHNRSTLHFPLICTS